MCVSVCVSVCLSVCLCVRACVCVCVRMYVGVRVLSAGGEAHRAKWCYCTIRMTHKWTESGMTCLLDTYHVTFIDTDLSVISKQTNKQTYLRDPVHN